MSTIICLDPGMNHTGIAISYDDILATPLTTYTHNSLDNLVKKLNPLFTHYHPDKVIIGQPEYGPTTSISESLKEALKRHFRGEIIFQSESGSSKASRHLLKKQGKSIPRRESEEHQVAAAIILQEYLDTK